MDEHGDPARRDAGDPADRDLDELAIGSFIRARRVERGWSLKELAERCDFSVSYLSQIERGIANPTLGSVKRIGHALDFMVGDLLASSYGSRRARPSRSPHRLIALRCCSTSPARPSSGPASVNASSTPARESATSCSPPTCSDRCGVAGRAGRQRQRHTSAHTCRGGMRCRPARPDAVRGRRHRIHPRGARLDLLREHAAAPLGISGTRASARDLDHHPAGVLNRTANRPHPHLDTD